MGCYSTCSPCWTRLDVQLLSFVVKTIYLFFSVDSFGALLEHVLERQYDTSSSIGNCLSREGILGV